MKTAVSILNSTFEFDPETGLLSGEGVVNEVRTLTDMEGMYLDGPAFASMDPTTIVYSTSTTYPVEKGKEGGLFCGVTTIQAGKVGSECFMTKGHFHAKIDTAEFYWGIRGEGVLLLMTEDRSIRAERMSPGSVHYIPGRTAHRTVNTGDEPFVFAACWPSDAGYDYGTIRKDGFSGKICRSDDGQITLEV